MCSLRGRQRQGVPPRRKNPRNTSGIGRNRGSGNRLQKRGGRPQPSQLLGSTSNRQHRHSSSRRRRRSRPARRSSRCSRSTSRRSCLHRRRRSQRSSRRIGSPPSEILGRLRAQSPWQAEMRRKESTQEPLRLRRHRKPRPRVRQQHLSHRRPHQGQLLALPRKTRTSDSHWRRAGRQWDKT